MLIRILAEKEDSDNVGKRGNDQSNVLRLVESWSPVCQRRVGCGLLSIALGQKLENVCTGAVW